MSSSSAESYAFTVMTALGMFLVLLPLPWHWQARNFGTLLYIAWTFIGNLIYFVNSIVWRGNMANPSPIWCDISTKLAMGLGVAYPACALCINRRLYNIATSRHVSSSPSEKRKQTLIDLSIGLGIPLLIMALHIVVQGHRYDIYEDVGCWPTVYTSVLSIVLISIWPSVLGLISIVYCVLSIKAFMHQRRTFQALLVGSKNSKSASLNLSRYFRLMALAGTDILLSVPFSLYILHANIQQGLKPWISWSYVHWGFSQTPTLSSFVIKEMGQWTALEVNRWSSPICAIIFFAFFGLAGESLAAYKRFFARLFTIVGKPFQPLFARLHLGSGGDRKFDGGVTLPSTPGAASASSPGWREDESKSRFTEPPTPVSALKSSRPFVTASNEKKRRESDIESGLDYYFADEKTLGRSDGSSVGNDFVPPTLGLPPRALSSGSGSSPHSSFRRRDMMMSSSSFSSRRMNADVDDDEEKDLPSPPPSPPIFDIRRFSSSASIVNHDTTDVSFADSNSDIENAFTLVPPPPFFGRGRSDRRSGDDDTGSSALPSASDSAAFPLDLSSFPTIPMPLPMPASFQSSTSILPSSFQSSYSSSSAFAVPPSFPFTSSSLLTPASLSGQFRNSLPARYSFAATSPATGMSSAFVPLAHAGAPMGMGMGSSPPFGLSPLSEERSRHSYAGPASPPMGMEMGTMGGRGVEGEEKDPDNCYDIFPPTPMAM